MLTRRALLAAAAVAPPPPESIVLELPSAKILSTDWGRDIDSPVNPGSLWKPFLASAHAGPSPRFHCDGRRCWSGRRHGWLDLPEALAQSCNQWFHQLFPTLPVPLPTLAPFGLPAQSSPDWMQWTCSPRQLALAYAELIARRLDFPLVLAGLRSAASHGTARPLGRSRLAKTGTSPSRLHAGDGWVVTAYPVDAPQRLILYRQRGATGAAAAAALAAILGRSRL
jgi:hypothetical protein